MALARLMNITEKEILAVAERAQVWIRDLSEMTDETHAFLITYLEYKMQDRAQGIGTDDDELIHEALLDSGLSEEEEHTVDPEEEAWGKMYQDYCERKYGWDCS